MVTLIAKRSADRLSLSLPEGVQPVPGFASGGLDISFNPGVEVTSFLHSAVGLGAAATVLTGVRHIPLRESILVLDSVSGERLAYIEKV